jgi:ABC-type glycerol-3-phosphate transport system substrate-binding protein
MMKRIILALLILLVALSVSAQKLILMTEGDALLENGKWPSRHSRAIQIIKERYPSVEVEFVDATAGVQGGINVMLESYVASGRTPNVVVMTVMRSSKFFKAGLALDLKQYIPNELKKWEPVYLNRVTKDGHVYGLPCNGSGLALAINLTLAEEVGWKAPAPMSEWTMDSFMEFCKLLKPKKKYGTVLFAGSNPIPYVTCWWASFGVEFFKNGDYSKVAIDSPQTRKALAWMREMIDKGYTPPNASEIIDDDSVAMSAEGYIGANLWPPSSPGKWARYPFPTTPGVKTGGVFSNYEVALATDKKDKRINQISAELAAECGGEFWQTYNIIRGAIPAIKGIAVPKLPDNGWQIAEIVKNFGIYDMGTETAKYPVFRPVIRTFLAQFFDGQINAETFIKEYTKAANESLN